MCTQPYSATELPLSFSGCTWLFQRTLPCPGHPRVYLYQEHVDDCSSSNAPSVQVPRAIHVLFAALGAAAHPQALTAGSLPACRSLFSIKHLWMSLGQTLGKDQSLHTCLYQPFLPAAGMMSGCADSRAPPVGPFLAARTSACAAAC